ncbi:carcinoembryonic antigen-related cell adhesion molecule 5-like isoform X2 [Notolabrus celidotus]|uniref:carcinoembryonic antigen-related cell adhesion molecule 5-like isoform X2 n=1 Tax=Notolabrus celidotus TaxID=1203425 RepID=UPI0014902D17|nr:carcinoembryonic antigen-related cell adhesion molecule 5-like isoform X2 [Notolabrus celidotus]
MDLFAFKSLLFLLSFLGCCSGVDILPEGPVDVVLGKNVTLKTLLVKPTYAFLLWSFNDGTDAVNVATVSPAGTKVSEAKYQGRVMVNSTNGFLTLGSVKSEDSGDYALNMITSDGTTQTGNIELRVLEPVSAVAIKSDLPEVVEHNSTVVLTCSAKGSFLKFTWLKGTVPIKIDDKRLTVKEEELSTQLTIRDVVRTDLDGPIFCMAANKLETNKSAPFKLPVHFGPENVAITPAKPPEFYQAGSNVNLTCAASSSPPATFAWYHNKKEIKATGPVLSLKEIEKQGLGKVAEQYTCTATNAKTKRVIASPGVTFAVIDPITGVKISAPAGPFIAGNSSANFTCKAASGTVKTKVWMKDGKPLVASSRVVFSSDMSSVMINPLQKEDNGEFTCQLSNQVTTSKASHKMMVNYGPEPVTVKGEDAVEVNEPVSLTCAAASMPPANFTWKFNGTVTPVKTAQYIIEKAVYKNTGTYTCEAYNPVTKKTTKFTHTLAVKEEGALDEGLSDGAIAGIVIGVLVALGAAIALIMYCRQKVPVQSPY